MLTIILTTYNGARTLPSVLAALCDAERPRGGWKLLVVDNGSTDETRDIAHSYADRLPVTLITEPVRGQNRARNAGLAHRDGDLVVFLDDDAPPDPGALAALRRAADTEPGYAIFGSTVVPKWLAPPPAWIHTWKVPMGFTYSATDPSLAGGPVDPVLVFSMGMAVRSTVFDRGFRFDERVGPRGIHYAMGSETEFIMRAARAGFRCWHCPDSILHHIVHPTQMTQKYLRLRSLRYGRGYFRRNAAEWTALPPFLFGIPRYLIRQILVQQVRVLRAACRRDPETLFNARMELSYLLGGAVESRVMHREQVFLPSASAHRPVDNEPREVRSR
jgi:glycosyltransferase involved in cell wall biosynthesis